MESGYKEPHLEHPQEPMVETNENHIGDNMKEYDLGVLGDMDWLQGLQLKVLASSRISNVGVSQGYQ